MIDLMKKIPLFEGLRENELGLMEPYFSRKDCMEGEVILPAGGTKKELFIIASGSIVSTIAHPGSAVRKRAELIPGDFFGEIPLFAGKPCSSAYTAAGGSCLLAIGEERLRAAIENHPDIAAAFISGLLSHTIRQLRRTSTFLADVVRWGENASRRVITDELTGLYNRAFLQDALEEFFNISRSNNKHLSLLMIDIDNFRDINESAGIEAGNRILAEFAGLVGGIISSHGIMARYGGDEFSVLLPEADLARARELAERIRAAVEARGFSRRAAGGTVAVTTSIGISSFPETASDLAAFKEKADLSLYRAKESGRNTVAWVE